MKASRKKSKTERVLMRVVKGGMVPADGFTSSRLREKGHEIGDKMTTLTQKLLKELIEYNADTGAFSRRYYSSMVDDDSVKDKVDSKGRIFIYINGRLYSARKLAWLYMAGELPQRRVYSISGDPGDHRWVNLTLKATETHRASPAPSKRNKSGYVGVSFNRKKGTWVATIRRKGVTEHLGTFERMAGAVAARKAAERGEDVRLATMFI